MLRRSMSPDPITCMADPGSPSGTATGSPVGVFSLVNRSRPGDQLQMVEQVLHVHHPTTWSMSPSHSGSRVKRAVLHRAQHLSDGPVQQQNRPAVVAS